VKAGLQPRRHQGGDRVRGDPGDHPLGLCRRLGAGLHPSGDRGGDPGYEAFDVRQIDDHPRRSSDWQDVVHVPAEGLSLYVTFQADVVTEFRLMAFKEK